MDYQDPICCFDASAYLGTPDTEHESAVLDVPAMIGELDRLYAGRLARGAELSQRADGSHPPQRG